MEIRLVNPTEDGFLQRIDWNKAELEENVRSIVAAYQGLVYTEDTVSDAKNDRAALRKLLNEIEDRRKLVKKKCMEPYEVFESDLKDVTALIKEQISIIDGQVKEYENSVKEEKKARLQDVYAEEIGELAEHYDPMCTAVISMDNIQIFRGELGEPIQNICCRCGAEVEEEMKG